MFSFFQHSAVSVPVKTYVFIQMNWTLRKQTKKTTTATTPTSRLPNLCNCNWLRNTNVLKTCSCLCASAHQKKTLSSEVLHWFLSWRVSVTFRLSLIGVCVSPQACGINMFVIDGVNSNLVETRLSIYCCCCTLGVVLLFLCIMT